MTRFFSLRRLAVAVLLGLTATACTGGSASNADSPVIVHTPANTSGIDGLVLDPPAPKPAIVLTDTAGKSYDLQQATRDRLTYLYFGYTNCPDVCPTTMADLATALRKAPAKVRDDTTVVFVTTDPRHDTGPVLRAWLNHFSGSFVGLTGSLAQVEAAQRAAGVPVALDNGQTHSAQLFAFSPDGKAHVSYLAGVTAEDYAHDMPVLLSRWS